MNEQVKSIVKQEQSGDTSIFHAYIDSIQLKRPKQIIYKLDFLVTFRKKSTTYVKNMTSYKSKQVVTYFYAYSAGNLLTFDNDTSLKKELHHVNKVKNSSQTKKACKVQCLRLLAGYSETTTYFYKYKICQARHVKYLQASGYLDTFWLTFHLL